MLQQRVRVTLQTVEENDAWEAGNGGGVNGMKQEMNEEGAVKEGRDGIQL